MSESRKEEEEKSLVSITLGSEFQSLYTTQEDVWSRSDSCITSSSFIDTSFPESTSSCNNLVYGYNSDDSIDHVDIRTDIHQLWKQKKELEQALFEARQRETWMRPQLMRKEQLDPRHNLMPRKWNDDSVDRFQLRPIRVKTDDSLLQGIAARREQMRVGEECCVKKSKNNAAVPSTAKSTRERNSKPIRPYQDAIKTSRGSRHTADSSARNLPVPRQRPSLLAHDDVPRTASFVMNAMMWVSRSNWWNSAPTVQATQIRIPPPNRRI